MARHPRAQRKADAVAFGALARVAMSLRDFVGESREPGYYPSLGLQNLRAGVMRYYPASVGVISMCFQNCSYCTEVWPGARPERVRPCGF